MPPKRAKATRASIHEDTVEAQTPEQSPAKTMTGITEAQKQALVDNLQLEITERARKLRAQYAMQAQGLRTRLEMRVNRIPQGLRKRNIQDLLDEHAQREKPQPAPPVPATNTQPAKAPVVPSKSPLRKSLKRQRADKRLSDHISTADDKENAELPPNDLPNPKKRAKTAATTAANTKPASRTASRKVPAPPGILSPRSHNSRTLPKSPIKPTGEKEPSKFLSPTKATTTTAAGGPGSRAPSRAQQQPPNSKQPVSRTSTATTRRSAGSTGTTIVKSSSTASQNQAPAPAPVVKKGPGRQATAKQSAVSTAAAKTAAAAGVGGKKGAAAKKENLAPGAGTAGTGGTGRTLRKRG
ncbi:hypothetical protein D0868_14802 [Hortaea werneckii]|nr:hypothetical protein D0868_14802 [Hortaea werneckii]